MYSRTQKRRPVRLSPSLVGVVLLALFTSSSVDAANIAVDAVGSSVTDDGTCSLGEAIANANSDSQLFSSVGECAAGSGSDTIRLLLDVTLDAVDNTADDNGDNGLPAITSAITIDGRGHTLARDAAAPKFRFLYVHDVSADLTLKEITVSGGDAGPDSGGAIGLGDGSVTISESTFRDNRATSGGALARTFGAGAYTISSSRFLYNRASNGGAIHVGCCSFSVTLVNSVFKSNTADTDGGAIWLNGAATLVGSTFVFNTAGSRGGALFFPNDRFPVIRNVTLTGNTAAFGGGFHSVSGGDGGLLYNSIVSGNTATANDTDDCAGTTLIEAKNNVFGSNGSDGGCVNFDVTSANNTVAPGGLNTILEVWFEKPMLANHGGDTETVALVDGSPALDHADAALLPGETALGIDADRDGITDDPIDYDQRGDLSIWPRVSGASPDAGAFERVNPVYVDIDVGPGGNGTTWAQAFGSLRDALATANGDDQLWVAEGVYYPDHGIGVTPDDATETFTLVEGLAILGGFDGSETEVVERDVEAHVTVLSGDIDGDDANTDGNSIAESPADLQGTNAEHVVTAGISDASMILDGLTITAGHNGTSGAGILCQNDGKPTMRHLTVIGHFANSSGGGVSGCSSLVESSLFAGSTGLGAGGAWAGGNPTFVDVVFEGNGTAYSGGALVGGNFELHRCVLAGNSARFGGAISTGGTLIMESVLVSGNSSFRENSGAIFLSNGASADLTNVTLTGNRTSGPGGALFVDTTGAVTVTNSILWNNQESDVTGTLASAIHDAGNGAVTVSSSILQGSGGSTAWIPGTIIDGGGNLDEDPRFRQPVDPATAPTTAGDARVMIGSPAIHTGVNSVVTSATDLDGRARVQDGTVNMGPYEFAWPEQILSSGFESSAKLVFTTSATYNGDLKSAGAGASGLEGADNLCNQHAHDAGLPGTYTAWISADGANAAERISQGQGPYYKPDGTGGLGELVADDHADILSNEEPTWPGAFLKSAINKDENGASVGGAAWTDTRENGNLWGGGLDCQEWTAGIGTACNSGGGPGCGRTGGVGSSGATWTNNNHQACDLSFHLYCFQD